jgi:hypothetical protein
MSVEPTLPDDVSFVVLAGGAVKHSKEIKDVFTEMGFEVRWHGVALVSLKSSGLRCWGFVGYEGIQHRH